ncbi:hypothetical protein G6F31_020305 [Rhizopus arrhizus]|nr:hypothetical protein G6F31_020305 [Rhizopus arrhizus]
MSVFFVRRERALRGRLTRDELTGVLSQQELHRRARAWLAQTEGPARRGAFFLVSFEQYAEISAMLRAGEDQSLLVQVAKRLGLITRTLGGMVARVGQAAGRPERSVRIGGASPDCRLPGRGRVVSGPRAHCG